MEQVITNRIDKVFEEKKDILNVYFTAGFPKLNDTLRIAQALESSGADMIEIGIPFSDPVADGPTIQDSSQVALSNGMTIHELFEQLIELRSSVSIPVLLMGYINPILQYGMEAFCKKCAEVGVDGLIIPDLPMLEYEEVYKSVFEENGLHNIFLISPNTSESRIRMIDQASSGFIYMVSSSSVTGAKAGIDSNQIAYFKRIQAMKLTNPTLIGFGISDRESFTRASEHANGAIIGSAFIKQLMKDSSGEGIGQFVKAIKGTA